MVAFGSFKTMRGAGRERMTSSPLSAVTPAGAMVTVCSTRRPTIAPKSGFWMTVVVLSWKLIELKVTECAWISNNAVLGFGVSA